MVVIIFLVDLFGDRRSGSLFDWKVFGQKKERRQEIR